MAIIKVLSVAALWVWFVERQKKEHDYSVIVSLFLGLVLALI